MTQSAVLENSKHLHYIRYLDMRVFRTNYVPHSRFQLLQIGNSLLRTKLPPVLIDNKRRVLAGWGQVEFKQSSILASTIAAVLRYSDLTAAEIRQYKRWMRAVAKQERWGTKLLALELQGLTILQAKKRAEINKSA